MKTKNIYAVVIPAIAILLTCVCILVFSLRAKTPPAPAQTEPATTQGTAPVPVTTAPPQTTAPPPANPYTASDFAIGENGYLTCLTAPSMLGVDVSEYQGDIDWQAVADAGVEFAMIRAGFRGYGEAGKLVEDENARHNIQAALDAGLKVGVYFFSQATSTREALQEARLTLEVIQGFPIDMPVVFDWEYVGDYARTASTDSATVTACTTAFCSAVALAGYEPMFYSNQNLGDTHFDLSALSDYPMWLAMYDTEMTYPHRLFMWQYTCDGTVPGIEGAVDLNLYLPETR